MTDSDDNDDETADPLASQHQHQMKTQQTSKVVRTNKRHRSLSTEEVVEQEEDLPQVDSSKKISKSKRGFMKRGKKKSDNKKKPNKKDDDLDEFL